METTLCKIREIYRSIVEYEAVFRRVHGLKLNEGMLLCTLSDGVRKTSGELSDLLGVTPSNMSKIISSAEKATNAKCFFYLPNVAKANCGVLKRIR
jgi:hypothetical protein